MRTSLIRPDSHSLQSHSPPTQPSVVSLNGINCLADLLKDCSRRKDLSEAQRAFSLIIKNGLQGSCYLACLLIRSISICGDIHRVCHIFLDMCDNCNSYLWTAIIEAHVRHSHFEKALTYYEHLLLFSASQIPATFVAVLKACDRTFNLEKGMLIHVDIAGQRADDKLYVQSALISMYVNCGCLQEASGLFDGWPSRDLALWSVMVKGFLQHKELQRAFELVEEMQIQGSQPNKATIIVLLTALKDTDLLVAKEELHSNIVKLGLDVDIHIRSCTLNMYFKDHRLTEALNVFEAIPFGRDVVSWNIMIAGMAENGCNINALKLLSDMQLGNVSPNEATFVCILKCIGSEEEGRSLHIQAVILGLEINARMQSSLINMYIKFFCLKDERNLLNGFFDNDVVPWSSILSAYVEQGQKTQAFSLYLSVLKKGMEPDEYTFSCLLQATETLHFGHLIHADIVEHAFDSNSYIGNNIIGMYCKCGSLHCAQVSFDSLVARDAVSFSTLITGYLDTVDGGRAFQLFLELWRCSVRLDVASIICGLKACSLMCAFTDAFLIYSAVVQQGVHEENEIGGSLVDCFAKLCSVEDSRKVFEMLHKRDLVTYSALISGYVGHGQHVVAWDLSRRLQIEGLKPDATIWVCMLQACTGVGSINQCQSIYADIMKEGSESSMLLGSALITLYSYFGKVEDAQRVFDQLHLPDVVVWSTMISCYVKHENFEAAIELFMEFQENLKPNIITLLCLLKACSQCPNLHWGMLAHDDASREGLDVHPIVANALVDMYCKGGNFESAIDVFKSLKAWDSVSWSTLLTGCPDHTIFEVVGRLFKHLQEETMLPDAGLFACLLRACSHGALINEGLHFICAFAKYNILLLSFDHWICYLDILGRGGRLKEAGRLALNMPFQPDALVWMSMLSSCVIHQNADVARESFLFWDELMCNDLVAGYVLVNNLYAAHSLQTGVAFPQVLLSHLLSFPEYPGCTSLHTAF